MPNDIASVAIWSINSASQGSKKIRRAQTVSTSAGGSVEAVNEVGSKVPVGFEIKPGAFTISIEGRETKGAKPEIDWEYLDETKEVFGMTRQVQGGRRTQYPECMVSKMDSNGEADGKLMFTVEIVALERKKL